VFIKVLFSLYFYYLPYWYFILRSVCCFNVFSSRLVLLCDCYFHHYTEKPAKCFKGWCTLTFYRLAPCLSLFFIIYLVQSQRPKTCQESCGRNIPTTSLSVPLLHEEKNWGKPKEIILLLQKPNGKATALYAVRSEEDQENWNGHWVKIHGCWSTAKYM